MQWIQENINVFNGDTNNVTLFGESAGAASVHLHILSQHANKLFHKAIMQSGTANMEWVFQTNPAYKTRRLAELMGFKSKDTKDLLIFLQSPAVKPVDFLNKSLLVMTADERRRSLPLPFKPVIEDSQSPDVFINLPIWDRLHQPNSIMIPSIMGYNSAEGLVFMVNALKKLKEIENDFHRLVPRNFSLGVENKNVKWIAQKMRDFYLNGSSIKPELLNSLTNIFSDYHIVIDMQNVVKWHARLQPQAPLYFYRFDYVGDRNIYKRIFQMEKLAGACHGDELFYLFQMAGSDMTVSKRDQKVIEQFTNLWSNFAKYANPTPDAKPSAIDCHWSPVNKTKKGEIKFNYLEIGNNGCQMKTNPDQERMEFWENLYKLHAPTDLSRLSSKL